MIFKADMHIHSVLSPCGDIEMSPSAIVAKAKERGMDIIGLTDHNSTLNADVTRRLGEKVGLHVLMGAEVTTKEEVHCLCFMPTVEKLAEFQAFLDSRVIFFENDVDRFGYQLVVDEDENVLDQVPHLLINALDLPMVELSQKAASSRPGSSSMRWNSATTASGTATSSWTTAPGSAISTSSSRATPISSRTSPRSTASWRCPSSVLTISRTPSVPESR